MPARRGRRLWLGDGPRKPRQHREGEWWIGTGMASAARVHNVAEAKARVTLQPDGTCAGRNRHDRHRHGHLCHAGANRCRDARARSRRCARRARRHGFPARPGSGGSWGAASVGSAVFVACEAIREEIAKRIDAEHDTLELKDGMAHGDGAPIELAKIVGDEPIKRSAITSRARSRTISPPPATVHSSPRSRSITGPARPGSGG